MKTHNLTVRITEDVKKQLEAVSEKVGISTSEYVRRLLKDSLKEQKSKSDETLNDERLKKLEQSKRAQEMLDLGLSGLESKFMMALGYVFSIDTGDPIHKIIKDTLTHLSDMGYSPDELDGMTREGREQVFMDLYGFFNSHLSKPPSEIAYLTVEAIFTTYLSFVYPSPIFMTTPFSLNIMNRLTDLKTYFEIAKSLENKST